MHKTGLYNSNLSRFRKNILLVSECDYVYAVAVGAGKLAVAWNETGVKIYNYMLMLKNDAHNYDLYRFRKEYGF